MCMYFLHIPYYLCCKIGSICFRDKIMSKLRHKTVKLLLGRIRIGNCSQNVNAKLLAQIKPYCRNSFGWKHIKTLQYYSLLLKGYTKR